jgi:hypothetical protein
MKVGVQRAAELTGKSRSTIQRAIKSGKLSAEEDETGKKVIDVTELEQVYGLIKREEKPPITPSRKRDSSQPELPSELERENRQAAERVKQLEEELAKLKEERDYWHRQASRLSNEQRQETEQKTEAGSRHPLSWLGWLFGRQKEKD